MRNLCVSLTVILAGVAPAANAVDAFLEDSPFHASVAKAAEAWAPEQRPEAGNRVCLVENGYDAFLIRLHLIRNAKYSIDLQTFIWAKDESATAMEYELVQALKRGVKIRVLIDHMWASKDASLFAFDPEEYPNLEVRVYRPAAGQMDAPLPFKILHMILPNGTQQRMHSKLMLVDGVFGMTGGRNFGNKYFNYSTTYNFKDREIVVLGPLVNEMYESFEAFWDFKKSIPIERLYDVAKLMENEEYRIPPTRAEAGFDSHFAAADRDADDPDEIARRFTDCLRTVDRAEFIWDRPGKKTSRYFILPRTRSETTRALRDMVTDSTEEILIQSPYVIVDGRAKRLFRRQQKRAPELEILVSTNSFGAADHIETYSANYRLRNRVVHALDFNVYEYKPHPGDLDDQLPNFAELKARAIRDGRSRDPFLSIHSKTFVFDGTRAFVGTFNLDPRSFYINSECGVYIEDDEVVSDLRAYILDDIAPDNSWVIASKERTLRDVNRVIERISSMSPIDLWPFRSTSGFELREGFEPVPHDHPSFYERYEDVGSFPGSEGLLLTNLLTRVYKVIGKAATPLL